MSKDITIMEVKELAHRDLSIVITKIEGKSTAVLSVYFDIKTVPLPEYFMTALEYCRHRNYAILIGADTNSHNKAWGKENNARGKAWSDGIDSYNIQIINKGREPTLSLIHI